MTFYFFVFPAKGGLNFYFPSFGLYPFVGHHSLVMHSNFSFHSVYCLLLIFLFFRLFLLSTLHAAWMQLEFRFFSCNIPRLSFCLPKIHFGFPSKCDFKIFLLSWPIKREPNKIIFFPRNSSTFLAFSLVGPNKKFQRFNIYFTFIKMYLGFFLFTEKDFANLQRLVAFRYNLQKRFNLR